jgi:signal transduction histidine kinase
VNLKEERTLNDIELLKAENAKLKQEVKETKALSNQYLQNVAHQLTAPLGAIKWSIEALRDDKVPLSRKKTLLSSIYSQATILVHLIKNFALMSELEADHELGQFREQPEPTDIMRLSINLANDFQPQGHEWEINIDVDKNSFSKIYGNNKLNVEKNMIAQAISNIIENSVKYADHHTTIEIAAISMDNKIGLKIESTGIPIPEEEKPKLFERGFRGHSAKQKVAAGTGFGLYLASRIMKFHGGTILIETHNKISRFILLFPLERLAKG